jgi:DNA-binding CsgD family transcriptional regulator
MKLLSYLSFVAFLGSVSVAAVSLWLDRAWQNRTVAAAALFYAVWALGMTFAFGSSDPATAVTAYRLSFFGSLLYAPVLTAGYLALAQVPRAVVAAHAAVFGLLSLWSLNSFWTHGFFYARFDDGPWGNYGVPAGGDQFWALLTPYLGLIQVLFALAAMVVARARTASGRLKRQFGLLIPGLLVSLVLYFLAWGLELAFGWPNVMVLCGLPLLATLFWVIFQYRYLRPNTQLLARFAAETGDAGVLLDSAGTVLAADPAAAALLKKDYVGTSFARILEGGAFAEEWVRAQARRSVHRRLPAKIDGRTVLLTLSARFGRSGSFVGAVVFLRPLEHWDLKVESLGMTARERDILFLLLEGGTVPEIADRLTLAPGTVRRHCHNIFDKARVSSRAELLVTLLGTA